MSNGEGANGHARQTDENSLPSKSPLLTQHRLSDASDMDEVNLEEDQHSPPPTLPPKLPPRNPSGLQGFSGTMAPVNFPPPPAAPAEKPHTLPPPAPPTRKITSPFSWLSRGNTEKKVTSPPLPAVSPGHDRRNTNASMATIGSNPELMLSKIEDEGNGEGSTNRSSQSSLRDRFKLLRMREEAGITSLEEEHEGATSPGGALSGLVGRTASVGLGIGNPTSITDEKDEHVPHMSRGASSPGPGPLTKQPTINPNLAPGTAAGFTVGPAESAAPVDWDLWQSVVYEGPAAVARTSSEELNQAIASGIPQAIRGVVWQVLAQSKNEELEGVYKELVVRGTDKERVTMHLPGFGRGDHNGRANGTGKEKDSIASSASSVHSNQSTPASTAPTGSPTTLGDDHEAVAKLHAKLTAEKQKKVKEETAAISKLEKAIKRDLGARTSYSKYVMANGLQDGLFGLCKAYALFDEAVGYAQGMNFIVMPLLFNMPEEEAFCLLVRLMNKYGLRDLFINGMPGLHLHLYQFERLLEDFEPALYCHLNRRGVKPDLYATQWFLTLFAYRFPLQLVLRIYDLILSEGLEGAILKFGIVLMQKNAQTLLGMRDMSALTTFLKERLFDVYIDKTPSASSLLDSGFFGSTGGIDKEVYRADMLVQDACAVKVTPEMLKLYATEWREKQQVEKQREEHLESLEEKCRTLTMKVRSLEERAEKSDTEHVQMASELVRTKVENETLGDENESLKTRVEELQRIVEKQPEEVEAKLRTEMDTVMQKNIVVHNENRALEEQLADMEKELVETKMQWAEINSEHETLKQKWNNITHLMNSGK
ncbi:RabGAP/TBC [Mytilinidion resinicola]|uniref:GTPase-activating protein GYP5 n=1 Tax=Mytilinidion resinicola TaxID=574789 RepID=A0A6A6Y6H2_9PEZI|nr:RabGAP/TBC [Mytilinidion resinicola]KAF2803614.1 RabGAP/TBC [Mytilinidion resinicola]